MEIRKITARCGEIVKAMTVAHQYHKRRADQCAQELRMVLRTVLTFRRGAGDQAGRCEMIRVREREVLNFPEQVCHGDFWQSPDWPRRSSVRSEYRRPWSSRQR